VTRRGGDQAPSSQSETEPESTTKLGAAAPAAENTIAVGQTFELDGATGTPAAQHLSAAWATIARISQERAVRINVADFICSRKGADAEYQRAHDLALKLSAAHIELGNLLADEPGVAGAVAEFRAASDLDSTDDRPAGKGGVLSICEWPFRRLPPPPPLPPLWRRRL
jgi:hypothetical protein